MTADYLVSHAPLAFFNSLSRAKETFRSLQPGCVKMYTCGPTVYDYAHIGNFRTYVFEDLLRRTLTFFGYRVTQVMNLTDVDDKTIRGAIRQNTSLKDYTKPFENAFFEDLQRLHIQPAEHYPAATDYIPQMIEMIQQLIQKGVAYQGKDESVYFAIERFPHYGCLSHLDLGELRVGASERVVADEYEKDNVSDFVLWKAYDPERDGMIFWESPWGKGRPGWHLECSTMAMQLLGETLDIHCGGVDNMFPHHENEIAQSEACSGKQFVNTWLHAEHLVVDGRKMSKSLGNFYTLRDLMKKGYSGLQVRYLLMGTHYRSQLNFTLQGLDGAKNALQRLQDFVHRLRGITQVHSAGRSESLLKASYASFAEALADDLNISAALGVLFDLVREVNSLIDAQALSASEAQDVLALLEKFNTVLAVLELHAEPKQIPQEVLQLVEQRTQARKDRQWAQADALRARIAELGYVVEDSPQGAFVKPV